MLYLTVAVIHKGPGLRQRAAALVVRARDDAQYFSGNQAAAQSCVRIAQVAGRKRCRLITAYRRIGRWVHKRCLWGRTHRDGLYVCNRIL